MSMINKLCIQGIRSFGDDRQKIEFNTPLTLIVGENGCGKTTVIECLKYALTGDLPPGSNGGKNFVHDVKLLAKNSSDARVELTITDPKGLDKTVFRTMRLECNKGKTKFQTFDSTIKYSGDSDKFTSGRKEDINNHMCESMGVSKAIINNVIFCHQEDSNWPLDEGKKLKEKFDAIFGTTEYNNTIVKIQKIRKGYDDQLKEVKGSIKYWEEVREQVERKERDLQDLREKVETINTKYEKIQEQMVPLEKKKEQSLRKLNDYESLLAEGKSCTLTIESKKKECISLKKNIKTVLSGTIEDLELQKQNFLEHQEEKEAQLKSIEAQDSKLKLQEFNDQKQLIEYRSKAENCIDGISKLQDKKAKRFDEVKKICRSLDVDFDYDNDQSANTQVINETFVNIQDGLARKEKKINAMKKQSSEDDANYQKNLDKLREEKTKIETNLTSQRKLLVQHEKSVKEIQSQLKESEESIPTLKRLDPKIEKYQKKLDKLNEENNVNELKDSQDTLEVEVIEYEEAMRAIDNEIDILQSASRITSELEIKEKDMEKDQRDLDRLRNKLTLNFKNLFASEKIESNYRTKVQSKRSDLEKEVKGHRERFQFVQRETDKKQVQRTNLRSQQDQKDREIHKIEQQAKDLCHGKEYLDVLASQKEKVEHLNKELAVKESSRNTYKDFISQIDENPCCPLCHKGLEDDADNLKVELEENIQELPKKITEISKKLKIESEKYDKLNGFRSSYNSLEKLKNEKKKIESDLEALDEDINKLSDEKGNLEMEIAEPESLLNIITPAFFADVCKLDDLHNSITKKSKEVAALKDKLPDNIPKKTLAEAQSTRKKTNEKIKSLNEKKKQIHDQITTFQTELNETHEQLNKLKAEKNEIQQKVQGIEVQKEQLVKIKKAKQEVADQIQQNEDKLQPTIKQFNSLKEEKKMSMESHQKQIDSEQRRLNQLKLDYNQIERMESDIQEEMDKNYENTLTEIQQKVKALEQSEKSVQANRSKLAKEIEELKKFLANEETTHRNILDNIRLLEIQAEINEVTKQLADLKEKTGDFDIDKLEQDKKNVLKEIHTLIVERTKLSGQEDEINIRIETVENELNEKKYKDARQNHMNAVNQEQVLTAAVSDLKKYCASLEKFLLKYHQDKMDQINQIMKELWNNIYQGNDIDYILIKTDEEEETKTVTEKSRRSYNYRVVQVKNGTEIDMRGRCSAGQKVLASLIIRIALADTFSSSCGILALDEPTTNLDHNNVTSLSLALAQLVAERDNGRFMLVIITHDENFVRSLERAEKYWKLSRDNNGCSVIEEFSNY